MELLHATIRCLVRAGCAALLLALSLGVAGCEEKPSNELSTDGYPVSIAYWRSKDRLLIGDYQGGAVRVVKRGQGAAVSQLLTSGSDGRRHALRLAMDEKRGQLWILDTRAIYVYVLTDKGNENYGATFIRAVPIPPAAISIRRCMPALALDGIGNAYVSSNAALTITVVNAEYLGATSIRLKPESNALNLSALAGLTVLQDGATLIGVDALNGQLIRIDLRTAEASLIRTYADLTGGCGFVSENVQPQSPVLSLLVLNGFDGGVVPIELSQDLAHARQRSKRMLRRYQVFSGVQVDRFSIFFPLSGLRGSWELAGDNTKGQIKSLLAVCRSTDGTLKESIVDLDRAGTVGEC